MNGAKVYVCGLAAVLALPLIGCSGDGEPAATRSLAAEDRGGLQKAGGTTEATFIDSKLFDEQLKDEFALPRDAVVVHGSGLNVNQLPPRLDKWFTAVKETGGTVMVRAQAVDQQGQTRFFPIIGALLGAVSSLWTIGTKTQAELDAQEILDAAEDYDAEVTYDHETGLIEEVKFTRRPAGRSG